MPRPRTVFLGVLAAGALLFVALAFVRGTSLVYTLGVPTNGVAVQLKPDRAFCQTPIVAQTDRAFDRIVAVVGTYRRPGPPLDVYVRNPDSGAVLAHGTVAGGYPDIAQHPTTAVQLDRPVDAPRIAVCFQNKGTHSVAFYGAGDAATQPSTAQEAGGGRVGGDAALSFEGPHHSWASTLSDTVAHAVLFRTPRLPGWLYLVVLLLLAGGAAAAMTAAVGSALEPEPEPRD